MGTLYSAGSTLTPALLNQYYGYADTTSTPVTAASQTRLTTSYSIPAGEPSVGSAYEVLFGGTGTWGSTQTALSFTLNVGGVSVIANVTVGAQAFSASASFRYAGRAVVVWAATGSSGDCFGHLMINLSQVANNIAPPGSYSQGNFQSANSIGMADADASASGTIDTTSANAVQVKCAWGSASDAATITNEHTIFRKVA